jgi:hypothetical protein
MRGIFEVCHFDGLKCHDTRFHKDWFRRSEVNRGDSQTHREYGDCISLLSFFFLQNKRLEKNPELTAFLQHGFELWILVFERAHTVLMAPASSHWSLATLLLSYESCVVMFRRRFPKLSLCYSCRIARKWRDAWRDVFITWLITFIAFSGCVIKGILFCGVSPTNLWLLRENIHGFLFWACALWNLHAVLVCYEIWNGFITHTFVSLQPVTVQRNTSR